MPKQYCLLFWNLKENLTTIVISAWFVLLWVKRTTHSRAPSEKQHLAYLCLPWPELWAVSTATSTADGRPAVLLFMSVLHNYLPFSIRPLSFPPPQPWALVELPNLRKSPYLAICLRFFIIIIMVGVGRWHLYLACTVCLYHLLKRLLTNVSWRSPTCYFLWLCVVK